MISSTRLHDYPSCAMPIAGGSIGKAMRVARTSAGRLLRLLGMGKPSGPRTCLQVAIVIPVAAEVGHEATKFQIEILRKFGRNPGMDAYPHLTLKLGFNVTDLAPFEDYLGQVAVEFPPFEISLRNFGFFDEGILFLDVESNADFERLRQRILSDLSELHGILPHEIEDSRYHPHVTLAYGLSKREFSELRNSFAPRQVAFRFQARHLDLLCHNGRQWVCCKRTPLQGDRVSV